jgi:hypothetical protein
VRSAGGGSAGALIRAGPHGPTTAECRYKNLGGEIRRGGVPGSVRPARGGVCKAARADRAGLTTVVIPACGGSSSPQKFESQHSAARLVISIAEY